MHISAQFTAWGERPALIAGGRTISYSELGRRVAELAAGLGPGKRLVAIEAANSEHAAIAYLAALDGGHAVALIAPGDHAAMQAFEQRFRPDCVFRSVDGRWRRIDRAGGTALHPDLALLLATSGSTGRSRFVRLSRRNVETNAQVIAAYLGLTQADRAALVLPIHYCYGLSVLNAHLAAGASVFLATKGVAEPGFAEQIGAAGCTNLSGVPYTFELMEATGWRDAAPPLRFMTVAGGRLPPELADRYRRHMERACGQLFVMYGQTEATARIAYVPPERLADNPDAIGIAIPGGEIALYDEAGRAIEQAGQVGELVYRGPNVMMGYADSAADLARGAEVEALRTGDLGERTADGLFRIVGRLSRFSKIGGLRIGHEAVEHALRQQGIAAAVSGDDRRLVAAFTSPHAVATVKAAMKAATGLAGFHLDAVAVGALPRLASGKPDHQAIARLAERRRPQSVGLLEAFRTAFFPKRVTRGDSFDSLGGDSLAYVQLSQVLEQEIGHIPMGWEARPICELAAMARVPAGGHAIESELVLRAGAILLIVLHHATLWPIPGGAAALMLLVGYSLARFHGRGLIAGDTRRPLRAVGAALAVYAPVVAGFALARGEVPWPSVLLIGNLGIFDPRQMMPYLYWFVEAYAQVVLAWCGLFLLPAVRAAAGRDPFSFGMVVLAAGVALKFAAPLAWPVGAVQIFTAPDVFYLSAVGWTVFFAREVRQKWLLMVAVVLLVPLLAWYGGNWTGSWVKFSLQAVVVAILLFVPRLAAPRQLAAALLPVAAAGYHIYLFHRILPELLLPKPDPALSQPLATVAAVIVGIASGLAAYRLQKLAVAALLRLRRRPLGRLAMPLAK